MATELATGYVSLLPSAKGFGRKAAQELGAEMPEAGRSAGEGAQEGFSAGFLAKGGLIAVGGTAAALIFEGFGQALDQERSSDKLAAQLGLNPADAKRFGDLAGDIYSDAFGDSFDDVNNAIGAVVSTFGDASDESIRGLTEDALNLAATFDTDVNQSIADVGVLISEDLVDDAEDGFDAIVRAMQELPAGLRDALSDATSEYSKFFGDLGFTASEMFALFSQSDDQFTLDKTGDAIKEFTIRATDMSALTKTAFETMGLDAETMASRILAGGDTARGAFDEIITSLLSIEDPVTRANTSLALFGTPLEDLGVNQIPTFLTSLQNVKGGLDDVDGAASNLGDTLNDNAASKVEAFKRGAMQGLVDFMGDKVIPGIEEVGRVFEEEGFSGALDFVLNEKLPQWLGDFDDWLDEEGIPAFLDAGGQLGQALAKGIAAGLADMFGDSFDFLSKGELGLDLSRLSPDRLLDALGLGGRASGGPVAAGTPYIVGERKPELFVPDVDGTILPEVPSGFGGRGQMFVQNIYNPVPEPASDSVRALRRVALEVA